MYKRIVFSGSGGQGVVTASIILSEAAALYTDLYAVQTQAYGPEARGGATRADVIISEEAIRYPKVLRPHILVCLTQAAYNNYSSIIRPDGLLLTDSKFVDLDHAIAARQVELGMYQAVMENVGRPIVYNICMLGAFIALSNTVKAVSVMKTLKSKMAPEFIQMNTEAFEIGLKLAKKYKSGI